MAPLRDGSSASRAPFAKASAHRRHTLGGRYAYHWADIGLRIGCLFDLERACGLHEGIQELHKTGLRNERTLGRDTLLRARLEGCNLLGAYLDA